MGSLVDTVVKVMLLMQILKMFLCSCYGPTELLQNLSFCCLACCLYPAKTVA